MTKDEFVPDIIGVNQDKLNEVDKKIQKVYDEHSEEDFYELIDKIRDGEEGYKLQ